MLDLATNLVLSEVGAMDEIFTKITVPVSEFKKNPNRVFEEAGGQPFAVITNNRASFYVLSPEHYDNLLELAWEHNIEEELLKRANDGTKPIPVRLEGL